MKLRCLVVDDDRRFLTAMRCMLEREGITADTAASGTEALECVRAVWPDIVLIDVRLSVEDGFDVVERLAARARTRPKYDGRPAIVLISDYAPEDFAQQIARSSATEFLDKSTLADHLSRKRMRELAAMRAGPSRGAVTGAGAYGSRGT